MYASAVMPRLARTVVVSGLLGVLTTTAISWTLAVLVAVNKWNGSPITQSILGPVIYASAATDPAQGEPATGSIRAWHRVGKGGALTGVSWNREATDPRSSRSDLLQFLSDHAGSSPLLESMRQAGSPANGSQSRGYFRFGWPFLALSKLEDRNFAGQAWSRHWAIEVPPSIFGIPRMKWRSPAG
jgi:hypothetical protein